MLFKAYSPERDAHLPRPVYALLALVCAVFGFWASVITLRYFEHGAQALEADEAARVLALAAALMFVAAEMAAFLIAAFLPVGKMWAQRWRLFGLAGAVLVLEVCTIVAVQLAITEGAEMGQQATVSRAQDLRNQIARIEANAATLRANAEKQNASTHAWVRQQGAQSAKEAARLDESTAELYAELGKTEGEKRPTLIGMLGERWALAYVVARGVLVSVVGLVFFGVAGAMWRSVFTGEAVSMGRSQAKGAPWWHILKAKPAKGATPQPAPVPQPPAPQPAPQPVPQPAPQPEPQQIEEPAQLEPQQIEQTEQTAHYLHHPCPVCRKHEGLKIHRTALKRNGVDRYFFTAECQKCGHEPDSPAVNTNDLPSSQAQALEDALARWNANTPPAQPESAPAPEKAPRKPVQRRTIQPGAKVDTGTGPRDGFRYRRVRAAVMAGKLRPSIRAIQDAEGGSSVTVRGYLDQMAREGIIMATPDGRSWQLVNPEPSAST